MTTVFIIIICGSIAFEDWKSYKISLWKLIVLLIVLSIERIINDSGTEIITEITSNMLILISNMVGLFLYSILRFKHCRFFTTLGEGDIVLLAIIAIGLPSNLYVLFIPLTAFIAIILHLILYKENFMQRKVPLASYITLTFLLVSKAPIV